MYWCPQVPPPANEAQPGTEATGSGRSQASVLFSASPWIDLLAHTIQDVISRNKGHNPLHHMIQK
jgi:hypothetical protein